MFPGIQLEIQLILLPFYANWCHKFLSDLTRVFGMSAIFYMVPEICYISFYNYLVIFYRFNGGMHGTIKLKDVFFKFHVILYPSETENH